MKTPIRNLNSPSLDSPAQSSIANLFSAQAARTPDQIAVIAGDERLTYRELDARTARLARHLQALGVGPETLVGLAVERSASILVAMLAILKSGGAYLPIDPGYPAERVALMLEDSRIKFLVTSEKIRAALPGHAARMISVDGDAAQIAAQSDAAFSCPAAGNNLAYVIYTSGSTGKPKGVMVEQRNVLNFFLGMDEAIGAAPGTWLAVTSVSFDISVLELLWTVTRGFRVVIHEEGSSNSVGSEMLRHGVTHLQSTPSLFRALLGDPQAGKALAGLKKLLLGGEALPASLVESVRRIYRGEFYNMYGPTETAIWSTVFPVGDLRNSIPIGKPIRNTQVYTLDSELKPAPVGELFIGGDGVVRGYWNRPELTAERFIDDPFTPSGRFYRTGDLARLLPDGNLEFLGRVDLQVKIRGYRIELGEVESVLERQPGVRQAIVNAREDSQGDKILVAHILPSAGHAIVPDSLRAALKAALPEYMVPSQYVEVRSFPLTANGKVDRKVLAEMQARGEESRHEEPQGEFEQFLADAWKEMLGAKRVSRNDNFFDLGGHSLAALKITFKMQQTYDVKFPLKTFGQFPVLRQQAEKLEELLLERADPEMLKAMLSEL